MEGSGGAGTVQAHFEDLVTRYESDVVGSTLPSSETAFRDAVTRLRREFEAFWHQLLLVGCFSSNETLEDVSTRTLGMLRTPYIIADLYQRTEGPRPLSLPAPGSVGSTSTAPAAVASPSSSGADAMMTREQALALSARWYDQFFGVVLQLELVDEKTLESYRRYRPDDRASRIELSRLRTEQDRKRSELRSKTGYLRAKARRMRDRLAAEDGEVEETIDDGELEEALRDLATAELRWAVYDACSQLQGTARELEMLSRLSPEDRSRIAAEYQANLDSVTRGEKSLGRHTYTILPGGLVTPGPAPATGPVVGLAPNVAYSPYLFRQQVRDELMVERNRPTMTLDEFAATEMAEIQRQQQLEAEMKNQQEEEKARLGPDGVEERDRQRDSKWADWQDDNPRYGKTNKGNYT